MRRILFYTIFLKVLTGCSSAVMEKPVWLNEKKIIALPNDTLHFRATGKNWSAGISSFIQPVALQIVYTQNGFYLLTKDRFGITEGPAQLVLHHDEQDFIYDLVLKNDPSGAITVKDYRSPKTVNPDSSLDQHRLIHRVDEWRNIIDLPGSSAFFTEAIIPIGPKAGTYYAQPDHPLSAYYVQPGSCTNIDVKAVYDQAAQAYEVSAGPLKDKHNNTVADGTMVAFIYEDGTETFRMEAALKNGFATISIPTENNRSYSLVAKVNETVSKPIKLLP